MKKYLLSLAVIPLAVITIFFYLHRDTFGATPTYHPYDIFANYTTWRKTTSAYTTADPILSSLGNFVDTTYKGTPTKFTFVDINGDNLPDFIYHEKTYLMSESSGWPRFYAVFLNNGNSNFNLAYKCVIQYVSGSYNSYGDCGGTKITDPNDPANQNMLSQVLTLANYYSGTDPNPNPYPHLWIDINGDGLQDYIDTALHINDGHILPF